MDRGRRGEDQLRDLIAIVVRTNADLVLFHFISDVLDVKLPNGILRVHLGEEIYRRCAKNGSKDGNPMRHCFYSTLQSTLVSMVVINPFPIADGTRLLAYLSMSLMPVTNGRFCPATPLLSLRPFDPLFFWASAAPKPPQDKKTNIKTKHADGGPLVDARERDGAYRRHQDRHWQGERRLVPML